MYSLSADTLHSAESLFYFFKQFIGNLKVSLSGTQMNVWLVTAMEIRTAAD